MTHLPTQTSYYPPPAPRPPTNGLGVAGFIVSLVGFFMGCVLCPIGMILSFFALFKRPRGFAIAGFILGLIGSIIPALVLLFFGFIIVSAIALGMPGINSVIAAQEARQRIETHASSNDYALPNDEEGDAAIAGKKDGWGRPLDYSRLSDRQYEIRSAGPDGALRTQDDLEQIFDAPARPKPE